MGERGIFGEGGKRISRLATAQFKTELAQRCGAAAHKKVGDCFNGSHDPYGEPWAPLKRRQGKVLVDTGRLRASISFQPADATFKLSAPVAYAAVHQFGAHIPPHSRTDHIVRHDSKGRFVGKRSKRKVAREKKVNVTFANGITIPARPFFPTKAGGIPASWTTSFGREFQGLAREALGL